MENQKIKIWVRTRGRSVTAVEALAKVSEEQHQEYKQVTFVMRPLTWGAHCEMTRKSKITKIIQGVVVSDVDQYQYRAEVFMWALIDWDYQEGGQRVPVTEDRIEALHENVVNLVMKIYDRLNHLSKTDRRRIGLEIANYMQSQGSKGGGHVSPPDGMVELNLMERFNWTPDQIDQIGMRRLQEIFAIINQKEISLSAVRDQEVEKQTKRKQI